MPPQILFACLQGAATFTRQPYHQLRHPMAFYYAHTAVVYINKLRLAGVLIDGINPFFEQVRALVFTGCTFRVSLFWGYTEERLRAGVCGKNIWRVCVAMCGRVCECKCDGADMLKRGQSDTHTHAHTDTHSPPTHLCSRSRSEWAR